MAVDRVTEHGQVMRALGRIEGKVDSLHESVKRLREDHMTVETRVRFLENWRWYVLGIAASVGVAASIVATFVFR